MINKEIKYIALAIALTSQLSNAQQKDNIYKKGWIDFNKNGTMDVYENPKAPIEKRVENLISRLF